MEGVNSTAKIRRAKTLRVRKASLKVVRSNSINRARLKAKVVAIRSRNKALKRKEYFNSFISGVNSSVSITSSLFNFIIPLIILVFMGRVLLSGTFNSNEAIPSEFSYNFFNTVFNQLANVEFDTNYLNWVLNNFNKIDTLFNPSFTFNVGYAGSSDFVQAILFLLQGLVQFFINTGKFLMIMLNVVQLLGALLLNAFKTIFIVFEFMSMPLIY